MISTRVRRRILCRAATLGLVLCSLGPVPVDGAPKPATHTVTIDASRYQPDVLTVKAGDTVVWVNKDIVAHTATSQAGGFDSGIIVPGKSWKHKFNKTGQFAYTCTYHPTMKATLRVN
jgi:plastocyanin